MLEVDEGLEPTSSPSEAGELVTAAFEIDPRGATSLNAFEHAIWRVESARTLGEDEDTFSEDEDE